MARLQSTASNLVSAISTLESKATSFDDQLKSLLDSETGKKIVESPNLVSEVFALGREKRPNSTAIQSFSDELAILREPLTQFGSLSESDLSELKTALNELDAEVSTAIDTYDDALSRLDAATSQANDSSPGKSTLRQAIAQLKRDRAAQRQVAVAKFVTEATKAETKELANLKAQRAKAKLRTNLTSEKQAITKAKFEQEFQRDLPQIRSLLQAFTSDGHFQPNPSNQKGDKTIEPGPMSLTNMQAMEVMQDNDRGRKRMYYVGGYANDRPAGSFPKYVYITNMEWKDHEITVRKAHRLLLKYADLMVEKGMLAP